MAQVRHSYGTRIDLILLASSLKFSLQSVFGEYESLNLLGMLIWCASPEHGKYLALDLGGTNFRALLVDFKKGSHPNSRLHHKIYTVPQEIMQGSGEEVRHCFSRVWRNCWGWAETSTFLCLCPAVWLFSPVCERLPGLHGNEERTSSCGVHFLLPLWADSNWHRECECQNKDLIFFSHYN